MPTDRTIAVYNDDTHVVEKGSPQELLNQVASTIAGNAAAMDAFTNALAVYLSNDCQALTQVEGGLLNCESAALNVARALQLFPSTQQIVVDIFEQSGPQTRIKVVSPDGANLLTGSNSKGAYINREMVTDGINEAPSSTSLLRIDRTAHVASVPKDEVRELVNEQLSSSGIGGGDRTFRGYSVPQSTTPATVPGAPGLLLWKVDDPWPASSGGGAASPGDLMTWNDNTSTWDATPIGYTATVTDTWARLGGTNNGNSYMWVGNKWSLLGSGGGTVNPGSAATPTTAGSQGTQHLAAGNDTTSWDAAVTPAGMAQVLSNLGNYTTIVNAVANQVVNQIANNTTVRNALLQAIVSSVQPNGLTINTSDTKLRVVPANLIDSTAP